MTSWGGGIMSPLLKMRISKLFNLFHSHYLASRYYPQKTQKSRKKGLPL
jgi:hypothetical protein